MPGQNISFVAGTVGRGLLIASLVASILTIIAYCIVLARPERRAHLLRARLLYGVTSGSMLGGFAALIWIVFNRQYQFQYAFEHTGNSLTGDLLHNWLRAAATWSGQEGSFLVWAAWTSVIGWIVISRARSYEARVMPFYTSILAFLAAILIWLAPFRHQPALAGAPYPMTDGLGLTASLQNYWMTIHPPTIFFGFASLAVPFCYAIAALIWKDYDRWTARVMPFALLTCATLGLGLFMGGYWAYETQGWHGFWAWDPVENASFFPWLAVTALVHGLVVQKSRGGMARTNTFLAIVAWCLFLLGTYLTRSGILNGASIHAFVSLESRWSLTLLIVMFWLNLGGGLLLWLFRYRSMPTRPTVGDTLLSRDFAFMIAIALMGSACIIVTIGTVWPIILVWTHHPLAAPKAAFYNRAMLPITLVVAAMLGVVPWLAWRKTDPDAFLRRIRIPWMVMLAVGIALVMWVFQSEVSLETSTTLLRATGDPSAGDTARAWMSPALRRVCVVSLGGLGFLAALSNSMLAYRVGRKKPLAAGGWLAHVGIGLLIIGVIVSNTYEQTRRFNLLEGKTVTAYGYRFGYEGMSGHPLPQRPLNPEYDYKNAVNIAVTPAAQGSAAPAAGISDEAAGPPFMASVAWRVNDLHHAEENLERISWPFIRKFIGHDLYIGLAHDPVYIWPGDYSTGNNPQPLGITFHPKERRRLGNYVIGYLEPFGKPGQTIGARMVILTPENAVVMAEPKLEMIGGGMLPMNVPIPELVDSSGAPGAMYLDRLDPRTKDATLRISLPEYRGKWLVPVEVTYKPGINLVWAGVLIAVLGTLVAMTQRAIDAHRARADEPGAEEPEADKAPGATSQSPARPAPAGSGAPVRTAKVRGARPQR